MSLLLDALHRASKDKEKAALAAANASAAESLSEGKFVLAAPTVPAPEFPDLVPSALVVTSAVVQRPLALAPEVSMVVAKPLTLEFEMELESSSPPAEKPFDKALIFEKMPPKDAPRIAENTASIAVAATTLKRTDSAPKSPNLHAVAAAAAIQNAYAGPSLKTHRPANRRAMVLAGIAAVLGLALASFALGVWGDPEKLLGLGGVSSVVPSTAIPQVPAAMPPPLVTVAPAVASVMPVASPVLFPAPAPVAVPAAAVASPPVAAPKKPPGSPLNEPVLRAAPAAPVFAARARSQSALEMGYAGLQAGRFDDASRAYTAALEANPVEPDALLGLAYIAHAKGQREEALTYYRRVLRQDPGNSVANAGLLALETGTNGVATGSSQGERAKELAARQPESAAVQALAANALVQEGALPDAALAFARAQALEPANPVHAYNLAVAFDKLGNYTQAAAQYEKALRISATATSPLGAPQASAARVRATQLRQSLGLPSETVP